MHSPVERPTDGRPIHVMPWRVRIDEMAGDWHVYYATYLHYLEIAAYDHLEAAGFPVPYMMETLGGLFMVRHVEIEYRGAAAAFDRVNVETWVESVGGVRLVRCTEFRKAETDQVIVVARVEWVWIDTNRRPRRVPQQIIDAVLPAAASATSADAST